MSDPSRWSLADLSAHVAGCWCGDRDLALEPSVRDEPHVDGIVLVRLPAGTVAADRSDGHRITLDQPVAQAWKFAHSPSLLELVRQGREDPEETISMRVDAVSASDALRYAQRHLRVISLAPATFTELPDEVQAGLLGRIRGGCWEPPYNLDGLPYYL